MNQQDARPSLWIRLSLMAALLAIPVLIALQLVLPAYGARAAVIAGFAMGIPAVLFVVWKIGWHRWLED